MAQTKYYKTTTAYQSRQICRATRKDGEAKYLHPVQFENGKFQTSDEEVQKFLDNHSKYGIWFKSYDPKKEKQEREKVAKTSGSEASSTSDGLKPVNEVTKAGEAKDWLEKQGIDTGQAKSKKEFRQIASSAGYAFPNMED